jgi:RimJ/RimL family protein N-acetyltransferase
MPTSPHPRLLPWTEALFPAWEALNRDALVAQWLGGAMDAARSRATFDRVASGLADNGWGVWAVLDDAGEAVGAAGLHALDGEFGFGGVEAMWRLRTDAVGRDSSPASCPRSWPTASRACRLMRSWPLRPVRTFDPRR